MNKVLIFVFLLLTSTNCSFDNKTGIWTKDTEISTNEKKQSQLLFKSPQINNKEFNPDLLVSMPITINYDEKKTYENNDVGIQNIKNKIKIISKYNFSKIKNFNNFDHNLVFYKNDVIFFDKSGTIFKIDNESKVLWKNNVYSKNDKKLNPILNFSIKDKTLIVTDNLSKYYAINIITGKVLWVKTHITNFISQIKIDDNQVYIFDANNTLNSFSLIDGSEKWNFQTDRDFIKSQKKTSIVFDNENVYFNNTNGDVYSLDKKNGNLIWVTSTKKNENINQTFLTNYSELVLNENEIYISDNQNNFFSLDVRNGFIKWSQNISSDLRPIIYKDIIFTISAEGFLFLVDKINGNIIRVNDLFKDFNLKQRKKLYPKGFVMNNENIFLTINNGIVLIIKISTGKLISILKVSRDEISKPLINNQFMYIVKDNQIIKLF